MSNPSPAITVPAQPATKTSLIVVSLLVVDSLHFIFAKLLSGHLPPATAAMFVMAVAAIEVTLFALVRGVGIRFDIFRRYIWFFLSIGVLIASSTSLNYLAVTFIDPGMAALLGKTSVLFGLGFGLIWLRERLTRPEVLGALVAIGGVFIVAFQPGDYLRLGSLIVIGSMFLYTLHTALVKRYGGEMDLITFFIFRLASTTSFLFFFNLASGGLVWPSPQTWLILALVGTLDIVISRGLYYLALRYLRLSLHSIILTLSPVLAIIWALWLFEAIPNPQQLLGGAAVLAGILVITTSRTKTTR
jgi:drug/metabolite transporter (DMT)-like permease